MAIADNNSVYLDQDRLSVQLKEALQETLFTSSLRIAPRRLDQLAQEAAACFLGFLQHENEQTIRDYGLRLVQEGVGHRSILAMTDVLVQYCWEEAAVAAQLGPVSRRYIRTLLEGYMTGREAAVLAEQERTRCALERARAHVPIQIERQST